ncbi:glycosyltransferase [Bifidobacterium sp. ESL0775]|uniref:glycosyltransferase n=1 Tax=Bifidobacterium sp. ESL0775 TaxID=2983230 RepID=UPI0023F9FC69|nr:glycosyltransferase [Bifidobacterium sp. ESL0775]WEV70005.1 glycosyltransferase [Bifidobacterium sp. ESL0775]
MNTAEHSFLSRHKTAVFAALAGAVILLLECVVFNLPFWTTLSASRDSQAALNTLGPGLSRQSDGTIRVNDPASAFLMVDADGSSRFVRLDPAESTFRFTSPAEVFGANKDETASQTGPGAAHQGLRSSFHIRIDANGRASRTRSVSTHVPNSLFLTVPSLNPSPQVTHFKVWIEEPAGTQVDIAAVHANVRVPFHADWGRVLAMAAVMALLALWMPGSKLWRVRLNTASGRQHLTFAGFIAIAGVLAALAIVRELWSANAAAFHEPGNYTYDFNQYGHLADALLHGRVSVDLPVPDALRQAANPYDPQAREALLAHGVSPIYWDYAYHDGHWYSYFGVLPALLLFAPYRLVTSWFTPGGLMLPSGVAVALLLFVFVVFGSLLVIRVLKMARPSISLAATSMAITVFLLGSQAGYLAFRMNFYSVPFAASLALSVMGLWFWLGAIVSPNQDGHISSPAGKAHDDDTSPSSQRHTLAIGDAPALSWPHLAAGSLCLAANFGCRPTFTLIALLAFPIFWPQIRAMFHKAPTSAAPSKRKAIIGALAAVLLPALIVVIPLCAYNAARFGSPIDFGERYQITVADMTHYRNALVNLLPTLGYYLFLPLRLSHEFPFTTINPTPLPSWSYTEPMVGGLFVLCPALLLVALLLLPRVRRRIRRSGLLRVTLTSLPLALLLLLVDTLKGGIGWRYMVDFSWIVALAATVVMAAVTGEAGPCRATERTSMASPTDMAKGGIPVSSPEPNRRHQFGRLRLHRDATSKTSRPRIDWGRVAIRLIMLLLVMLSIVLAFLIMFVPGREDALTRTDPVLFQAVMSWFMVW